MVLTVKVKPNNRVNNLSRDAIGTLTLKITAPAHDGKANEAVIKFLAETFRIPKLHITMVSGFTSSHKRLNIADKYEIKIKKVIKNL